MMFKEYAKEKPSTIAEFLVRVVAKASVEVCGVN
jgi:hypothetical protein